MCNECSICYEENPKCRLVCGHQFHHECIKEWYLKGRNTKCPICRNNICYRGMRKHVHKWHNKRREEQFAAVYQDVIFRTVSELKDCGLLQLATHEILESIEKDYKKLLPVLDDPEDMRYYLEHPDDMPIFSRGVPIYDEPTMRDKPPKKFKKQRIRNYHR